MKTSTLNVVALQLAILICLLVHTGLAIFCHNCSSVDDPRCADPFDKENKEFLIDCATVRQNATICRKNDQTVHGIHRIFRQCAWEDHKKYECYFGTSQYYKTSSCICRADGCNSAPYIHHNQDWLSLSFLLSVIAILY